MAFMPMLTRKCLILDGVKAMSGCWDDFYSKRSTEKFTGYGEEVAALYSSMDLTQYF